MLVKSSNTEDVLQIKHGCFLKTSGSACFCRPEVCMSFHSGGGHSWCYDFTKLKYQVMFRSYQVVIFGRISLMKFTTLKRWSKTVYRGGGATIDSTGCNFHGCFADKEHPSWMLLLLFLVQSVKKKTTNRERFERSTNISHHTPTFYGQGSHCCRYFVDLAFSLLLDRGRSQKYFMCFKCSRHWFSSPVVDFNCIMSMSKSSW